MTEPHLEEIQNIENLLVNPSLEQSIFQELKQKFLKKLCEEFKVDLSELNKDMPIIKTQITALQVKYLIDMIDNKKHKLPNYYYYRKQYSVQLIGETSQLVSMKDNLPIIALEDMFDACWKIHTNVGYQGRLPMEKEAKKFYCNISRRVIEIFLCYSEEYQLKRKRSKNHGLVVKPIRSTRFNERMQIDLIDFRTLPDGEFNWILNCQDHFTKFVFLLPLKNKTAIEVAKGLIQVFGFIGAPRILQSDNGKEFRNSVIEALKLLWPDLTTVHGRARRPQSQGSVERSNGDVQNILGSWMRVHKTTSWAQALPFVQSIKNSKHHEGIKMTPYNAVFGCEMFSGLEILNLPSEEKKKIKTAKQLFNLLSKVDEANEQVDDDDELDVDDDANCVVSDEILKIRDELANNKRKNPENNDQEKENDEELEKDEDVNELDEDVASRPKKIRKTRKRVHIGQERSVRKMMSKNKKVINSFKVGDLVLFKTDDVDRGVADAQNILCIILETKNDLFQLGCRAGVLDSFVAYNCIEKTNLVSDFNKEDIPTDINGDFQKVSSREAVRVLSVGHGQGFLRCNCTGQCATNRCSCRKNELKCSSRCHGKLYRCSNCD